MPAPIPYGVETLVNTTTTNVQKGPQVTALANGTYVAVWQDSSMTAPDTSFDSVRAQIFHANGTRLGSEFVLSEFPFAVQQDPVITALPDGRFVAAWESFNHSLEDQSGSHISARIFNPDGTPSTGEFQVNTHTDFWQTKPAIATLDNGGFVVTWMHDFVGGNQNYDIFARVYGANGQPVTADDRGVDISTGVIERAPVVTGSPGGKFVIAWQDAGSATQTDGSGSHIRAMIYTGGTFQPLNGPSFVVNSTTANDQSDPAITTLSNGNVVLSWTHAFSASDDDVRGRVFSGTGAAQSTDFAIDISGSGVRETESAIAALPNGQYVAVWRDSGGTAIGETDGSGSHIRGAIFSGNGSAVSGQFIINTTTNGSQGEPTVRCLADGRIVVAWTDFGMNGGDTSGAAVRSQILDPRTAAVTLADSSGNDEWVGTAFADVMNGGAGADVLQGAGGNDSLTGGAGSDTASYAGAVAAVTVDLSIAAAQDTGGAGIDTLATIENLTGSAFGDTLTGDGNSNVLIGGSGNDALIGGAGLDDLFGGTENDKLDGGSGADQLFGGAGNDTYTVDDASDLIREDAVAGVDDGGVDTVRSSITYTLGSFVENLILTGSSPIDGTGNGLDNNITGNSGANQLLGLDGNDTLTSGGGIDTMDGGDGSDLYNIDPSDFVHDSGAIGTDRVITSGTYTLAASSGVEVLSAKAGTLGAFTLIGDEAANKIVGNGGANVLRGLGGADALLGGDGDDKLMGGLGRDSMTGGNGADTFIFKNGDSPATPAAYDTVSDFATGVDMIDLDVITGAGLVASAYAEVAIGSNGFSAVLSAATNAMADGLHSVVFVAGSTDGWLLWNTDGDMHTPDQAVRLAGENGLAAFNITDLK